MDQKQSVSRLRVLKSGNFSFPNRCCGCGAESPDANLSISAPPLEPGIDWLLKRLYLKVPLCRDCWQWHIVSKIMRPVVWISCLVLMGLVFFISRSLIEGEEVAALASGLVIGPLFILLAFVEKRVLPFTARAWFDDHWLYFKFRSELFIREFYERNRRHTVLLNKRGEAIYPEVEIECVECGKTETWSVEDQRWWAEVAHGTMDVTAVSCKSCYSQRRRAALKL